VAVTEPLEIAGQVEEVAPGIWYRRIDNSRIRGQSRAPIAADGSSVFIDPVGLADDSLSGLPASRVR